MKKTAILLSVILLAVSCTTTVINTGADRAEGLQLDPSVDHGVLENGLQYFIKENHKPDNRIVLRLAVNAGSILEDDDQSGLAHLIEHMAFNGTNNYEKHRIVDYLESTGMKFGADINAHTGFDETVYKLNIPADDPAMLEQGLSILKEWAFEIAFDPSEIDMERGVVLEEWRIGRGAEARMRDKYFPVLFSGSKYADRLPIGDPEIIRNSSYETIKRFYHDWYRPELMSVIVVGEVDTEAVKQQIKDIFSPYTGKRDAKFREEFPVPDSDKKLYSIVSDPEASGTSVEILYKNNLDTGDSEEGYLTHIKTILANMMFSQRLSELTSRSNPPYIYAYGDLYDFVRTRSVFGMGAAVPENGIIPAFRTLLVENERFMRYGFTGTEFQRSKERLSSYIESAYRDRDKTESVYFAGELTDYFLNGTPAPGIEWERNRIAEIFESLTVDEITETGRALRTGSQPVVIITGPEKASVIYPSEAELETLFETVVSEDISPYEDMAADKLLMDIQPDKGDTVSEYYDNAGGFEVLRLSNGAVVAYKKTDFKNDELLFSAFSPGGTSLVPDDEYLSATIASNLVQLSGLADFSIVELNKLLAGERVSLSPYISPLYEGFSGSCIPEDTETLLQILNLYFTDIREDSESFSSFMSRLGALLENRNNRPEVVFQDTLTEALYGGNFRMRPITGDRLGEINSEDAYDIFQDRFAGAGDFVFMFTGNIPDDFEAMIETYVGSIPAGRTEESWKDRDISIVKGVHEIDVNSGIEEKSRVALVFSGDYEWSLENNTAIYALKDLLNIRLREEVREDASGTYGVGVSVSPVKWPDEEYTLTISFGCSPARVDELTGIVFDVINEVRDTEASDENIEKITEGLKRTYEESLKENSYWLAVMDAVFRYGLSSEYILDKPARNDSVDAELIKNAALEYLDLQNYFKAVLYPEN